MYETQNDDAGSLKVGTSCPHPWKVGDSFLIGERKFVVSYMMGKGEKLHLCCKGCGQLPVGSVKYSLIVEK